MIQTIGITTTQAKSMVVANAALFGSVLRFLRLRFVVRLLLLLPLLLIALFDYIVDADVRRCWRSLLSSFIK